MITASELKLQQMLNSLSQWCNKWWMNVNADKSKIIHFGNKKRKHSNFEFKCRHEILEIVNEY